MKTLFSLIESPFHPDFSALYQKLGIVAERFDSARNLHRANSKGARLTLILGKGELGL